MATAVLQATPRQQVSRGRRAEVLGQADAVMYEDKRDRRADRPRDVPPMGAAGGAGQA
jgi:hypothetical protein